MKKQHVLSITIPVLILLLSLVLTACGSKEPATQVSTTPLDGQALMEQRCTVCHTTTRITGKSATAEEWAVTVDRMIGKGAQLDGTEKQTLLDYLAQTYP